MITTIGDRNITLKDFYQILFKEEALDVSAAAMQRVGDCFAFLADFAKDKLIYGINTGFGPMAQYRIDEREQEQLQYNLIRSHCAGQGKPVDTLFVKALMIARLNTFLQGKSGVHPEVVVLLKEFINRDIFPVIFEHGSVGASGDLVQLAHLALSLIGEGKVWHEGRQVDAADVLAAYDLAPLSIHLREGLALMNGTSAMTGIGVVNLIHSRNLLNWSLLASSLLSEIVESYDDHYSAELNAAKHHPGQQYVAAQMRTILHDSDLVRKRHEHLYKKVTEAVLEDKVQEFYSIRCVPQILGPVYDTITNATTVVLHEINSVSDNPIIDKDQGNVYHGGNFHGDYVSLEMDKLKIGITKLSMLAERQLNFLLNNKLNQKLPPFVNLGRLGINLGMQGAQFVATSTVAENQTFSFPMYVHSIPNNNDNQDLVSMGTNSAQITSKVIENTYQVLAVQLLTTLQAVDYLGFEERLSSVSRGVYQQLRALVPAFTEDGVIADKILKIKEYIQTEHLQLPTAPVSQAAHAPAAVTEAVAS
ncbi:HAL/PAL/TAL family ammonia-lyase [Hymenobacter cavernae]|uniref:Histidine ammonia-lyase n=1 Tax=Hymenobacter cavernae TaxID=2044852 RepID=A0ABQ1TUU9_9BACT|nr:aromatic amino acid ammonia-lyase [Hymenobacter cavernae]GGF03925.1 histidine ammonia-lyase [Hymenobacter cavernae]